MVFKQKTGSRAQVMHGTAKMTGGGLKKKDLKYNKHGKIVSKKLSAIAKKEKRLKKAGWTTIEGQFGAMQIGGVKSSTRTKLHGTTPYARPSVKDGEVLENNNTVSAPLNGQPALTRQESNTNISTHIFSGINTSHIKLSALPDSAVGVDGKIYDLKIFKDGPIEIGRKIIFNKDDKKILLVDMANMFGEFKRHNPGIGENNKSTQDLLYKILNNYKENYFIVFICNTHTTSRINNVISNSMLDISKPYTYLIYLTHMFVNVNTVFQKYGRLKNYNITNEFDDLFLIVLANHLMNGEYIGIDCIYVLSNDGFSWFGSKVPDFGFDTEHFNRSIRINRRTHYLYTQQSQIINPYLPSVRNNSKIYVETPRELKKTQK